MKKTHKLPLFPLDVFAFPGEIFSLHIFEEKYKQMVVDLMDGEREFAIPYTLNGKIQKLGCLVRISKVNDRKGSDEKDIDVETIGIVRCLFDDSSPFKPYKVGNIEPLFYPDTKPGSRLSHLFEQFVSIKTPNEPLDKNIHSLNVFEIAAKLQIPHHQKFSFIDEQLPAHFERNLINFLQLQIRIEKMTKDTGTKFVLN
jgi:hypothetical protein